MSLFEQLLAEYNHGAHGVDMIDGLNPAAAFLLVEESPNSGHWLTTHDSMLDAAEYVETQDEGSWRVKQLVDLQSGETFIAVTTVTWKKES